MYNSPEFQARALLDYYRENRCVGHTKAALAGVEGDVRILAATYDHANQLEVANKLPRGTAVPLTRIAERGWQGTSGPLVLDHYAIESLLYGLLSILEDRNDALKKIAATAQGLDRG